MFWLLKNQPKQLGGGTSMSEAWLLGKHALNETNTQLDVVVFIYLALRKMPG